MPLESSPSGDGAAETLPPHPPVVPPPITKPKRSFGRWIENEGFLRDEGTACGLTGDPQGTEGKRGAIRAYYEHEAVQAERVRGPLVQRLEEARLTRSEARAKLDETRAALRETEIAARRTGNEVSIGHLLVRQVPTLLIAAVAAGCGYVFVHEAVLDDFASPMPIALAVVFCGSFIQFRPVSLLFSDEDGEDEDGVRHAGGWRVRAIELVPPVVAALFTCAWMVGDRPWWEITALGLFLLTLFFFCGKLALSTLALVAKGLERKRAARAKTQAAEADVGTLREQVEAVEAELQRADTEEVRAIQALAGMADRAEVEAERDYRSSLFDSEVAFAQGASKRYDLRDVPVHSVDTDEDSGDE